MGNMGLFKFLRRKRQIVPDEETHSSPQQQLEDEENEAVMDVKGSKKMIIIASVILVSYIGLGILFYSLTEKWNAGDAFYFTIVTLATVGYGDMGPKSDGTKVRLRNVY